MNCLTKQQMNEYLHGNALPGAEEHLAICRSCRTALLTIRSQEFKDITVSKPLVDKTIVSMLAAGTPETVPELERKTVFFTIRRQIYALAAMIVMIMIAVFYFSGHYRKAPAAFNSGTSSVALKKNVSVDSSSISQTLHVWLDTQKIMDVKEVKNGILIRPQQKNIVRIGAKTGALIEPSTVLHIKKHTNNEVEIELASGRALFTVEKNRYRSFSVQTPHVRIVVTGTVFSVKVDDYQTTIQVIEGSVQLLHEEKPDHEKSLEQGNEAVASGDSIDITEVMNNLIAKKRGKLLRDYIQSTVFNDNISTMRNLESVVTPDKQRE